jgi:hypothetical protein
MLTDLGARSVRRQNAHVQKAKAEPARFCTITFYYNTLSKSCHVLYYVTNGRVSLYITLRTFNSPFFFGNIAFFYLLTFS